MKQLTNAPPGITDPQQQMLWQRIQSFLLDDPNAALPFSRRLCREQRWGPAFAAGAIEEYKKFIFLCCIHPQGASPSAVIDRVWHLHLIYTKNYWDDFCSKTLQRQVHHHPDTGGPAENERHALWRQDTLLRYEQVFSVKPSLRYWSEKQPATAVSISKLSRQLRSRIFLISLLTGMVMLAGCKSPGLSLLFIPLILFIAIARAGSRQGSDTDKKKNDPSGSCSSSSSSCGSSCGSSCSSGCGGGCGGCGS